MTSISDEPIALHYIQPGKPDHNTFIARFNRSYRTEVIDAHLFEALAEVHALTERWLVVYNQGAAVRQPRPRAVPDVSAEAQSVGAVPFRSVYLTGKLTLAYLVSVYDEMATQLFASREGSERECGSPATPLPGWNRRPRCTARLSRRHARELT